MSRRATDPPDYDPTLLRQPLDVHALRQSLVGDIEAAVGAAVAPLGVRVDELSDRVESLAQRVGPVESHVAQELQIAAHREWARSQGWTPPPVLPSDPAPTTSPPVPSPLVPVDLRPRIWESDEGRAVIYRTLAAAVACALALAGGLSWTDIRGEVTAWVAGPGIEAAPPSPDAREPLDDSPPPLDTPAPEPRPVL